MRQLLAKGVHTTLVLLAEDLARGSGAVEDAVEICRHDGFVVRELAIDHPTLSPGDTGIGDEDVEAAAEVANAFVQHLLRVLGVGNIDLVCFACWWV